MYNRDMPSLKVYAWVIGIALVWWAIVGLFHSWDPFRSYLYWYNVNPPGMVALNLLYFGGAIAIGRAMQAESGYGSDSFNIVDWGFTAAAIAGLFLGIWDMSTYEYRLMNGIRNETYYKVETAPLEITSLRVSAYAEAQANFRTQNPDASHQIGTITYVGDHWIGEYGPKGFVNSFSIPTQGFYVYDPTVSKNPVYVNNVMPWAEQGILGNSLHVQIAAKDPFAFFDKVMYTPDPDAPGSYMAVISLGKRHGWNATPYVSNVVVFHTDGRQEWLTPDAASADKRFTGIQLIPEWMEAMRANAYSYPQTWWDASFRHTRQIQVQVSSTNEENSAPYHMRSGDKMYWVTPISPYNTPSLKGEIWQESDNVNSQIHVWMVPDNQAMPGVDALSATIKNSEGHPSDVKWLINNNGTLSGEQEILEMLPVAHDGVLYFVGYAAMGANPQTTRMFVIIRAADSVVMQDQFSIQDVDSWLQGKKDLAPLTKSDTVSAPATTSDQLDLSKYSTKELWDLLNKIINELQKRGDTGGAMLLPGNSVSYQDSTDLYGLAGRILAQIVFKSL